MSTRDLGFMSYAKAMVAVAAKLKGVTQIDPGLTEAECLAVEERYGFRFPDDLRALLTAGLPVGESCPNWRGAIAGDAAAEADVRERLAWPLEGLLFDIEHNVWWDPEWGARPADLAVAQRVATAAVSAAPVLIPVWGHRYLPAEPTTAGNPVFSVYQMDIIVYGIDLPTYLQIESGVDCDALPAPAEEEREQRISMNAPWWSPEQRPE